jgi:hypothetical protein
MHFWILHGKVKNPIKANKSQEISQLYTRVTIEQTKTAFSPRLLHIYEQPLNLVTSKNLDHKNINLHISPKVTLPHQPRQAKTLTNIKEEHMGL